MRNILFFLIALILATIVMAYLYFSRADKDLSQNDIALTSASRDAAFVVAIKNDRKFFQLMQVQDLFYNLMSKADAGKFLMLKDLFVNDKDIYSTLKGKNVYFSVVCNKDKLDLLLSLQFKDESEEKLLAAMLLKKSMVGQSSDGSYELNLNDSTSLFIGIKNRLLTISPSAPLIRERVSANISAYAPEFKNFIMEAERIKQNELLSLYLNFNNFNPLVKELLAGNFDGELAVFRKQNSFANLNYNFSKEKLLFNGFTEFRDEHYYELFKGENPHTLTINSIFPAKTANYKIIIIDRYDSWVRKLDSYFEKLNKQEAVSRILNNAKTAYLLDIRKAFKDNFEGQLATFELSTGEKLGAIAIKNPDKVRQMLMDISSEYDPEISSFREQGLLYSLFGDIFTRFERPFYVIKGNYLVFANTASTVYSFIRSYDHDELLIQNEQYTSFRELFPASANISIYVNMKMSRDIFRSNLKPRYYRHYIGDTGLGAYHTFCYQLTNENGKLQTNIVLARENSNSPDSLTTPSSP